MGYCFSLLPTSYFFVSILFIELKFAHSVVTLLNRKKNGKCLYTCAIRPAAIYGPGEERHFPRIVSLAKLGLLPFKFGDSHVKTDWIYVDNLVLALILASMGLLDDIPEKERRLIAAGQPYFVSDGNNHPLSLPLLAL